MSPREVDIWRARYEGLAAVLHELWRRGVGFGSMPGFDMTKPHAEQEEAFNKRVFPWLSDLSP